MWAVLQKADEEERRRSSGLPTPSSGPGKWQPLTEDVEQYHKMKCKILSDHHDRPVKSILFCSADPGEGNSTLLIEFSIVLASGGDQVILVDANLRDPSLHQVFSLERENGLTELILKKSELRGVIKKTSYDNLWLITSGTPDPDPFSILESRVLNSQVETLKSLTDWILFDSPALNTYSDSLALAQKVDGVIMVVQAERTRWEVVQDMKQRLGAVNKCILGAILNQRRFHIPGWVYRTL
jgi:capsular exopolysaccharide synthesis family protein